MQNHKAVEECSNSPREYHEHQQNAPAKSLSENLLTKFAVKLTFDIIEAANELLEVA